MAPPPLKSDLTIDASKFDRSTVDKQTLEFNEKLIKIWADGPRWYEVGAAAYRQMRWEGKTPLPKPIVLPEGTNGALPSRDAGREIPYRVFKPAGGKSRGIHMHIHGGGWVLMSEAYQDPYLKYMADHFEVTVVSIGYRLAPEDPWPAGAEDCYDAAEWLVKNGPSVFGGELMFTGGEVRVPFPFVSAMHTDLLKSAGGHLACLVAFHLLETMPDFAFKGLLLHFGCYDMSSFLPHVLHHETHLVIDHDVMKSYIDALLPNTTEAQRRDPSISPFWADLRGKKLPPALFTCGSEDPLLDDSVMMGSKWAMWGNESVVKIYHGAPHGFIGFPPGTIKAVQEVLDDTEAFVREKIGE
ncbi:esterase/lipase/thioesterase [Pyrenophora teres f. maculata]|nr:esterase/lipase/thioesterase [Pyrenophora teres f. maculata]